MTIQVIILLVLIVLVVTQYFLVRELRESIQEVKIVNLEKIRLLVRLENTINRMEKHTEVVADDLEATIQQADAADSNVPGASSDAAHRTPNDDLREET